MSTTATLAALIGSFAAMLIVSFSKNKKKQPFDENNVLDDYGFFFYVFSGGNIPVSLLSEDYEG